MRQRSFWHSLTCALSGLAYIVRTEPNAAIHVASTTTVLTLAYLLEVDWLEWAILILTIGLVLTAEALNTAIETLVDLITPQYHPVAKTIKDVAAGAVLLAALAAIAVGGLVFGPRLWERLI